MINQELINTIKSLKKASQSSGQAIWKALADELDKPKRSRTVVNLSRINRHTVEGNVVAVPGKVLGSGNLDHSLKIAAFSFSDGALEKIKATNSQAMSLEYLIESEIDPSHIKIMK